MSIPSSLIDTLRVSFARSFGDGPSRISLHPNWSHEHQSHKIVCGSDCKWLDVALLCHSLKGVLPQRWQQTSIKSMFSKILLLKGWSMDQQHQHSQRAHLKWKFMSPFSLWSTESESLKVRPRNLSFTKISKWFLCVLRFEICFKALPYRLLSHTSWRTGIERQE